ncbi:MAG: ATP-NAD kinase family protein [Desulfobacterales bacterium]|jgi:predicted polyphosphate/ATP-dependent NAD kinase
MIVNRKKLGLIVNPIAGMGGRVGLKGSDGEDTLRRARKLGATPSAPDRALATLTSLASLIDQIEMITYPAQMGESEARQAGFTPRIIGKIQPGRTTADDTRRAGEEIAAMGVDLLLFAGGDGTARDVYQAVGLRIPALGIPAGVKIHSGVYATTPVRAAQLAARYINGQVKGFGELEVMDIDEAAFRRGQVSARLYGYLKVPLEPRFTQGAKAASSSSAHEAAVRQSIAEQIVESMQSGCLYIIGSGTTPRAIMERLGLPNTLLGIDAVIDQNLVAADVNESQLLGMMAGHETRIIVTPIGGQGYIFGRGNQQLSPEVIKTAGVDNVMIAATPAKLASLQRRPLLVDTGDSQVDDMLRGYKRVVTGYKEEMVYRIA